MRAAKQQDAVSSGFADRRVLRQLTSGGGVRKIKNGIEVAVPDRRDSISDSVQTVGALIHSDRAAASRHRSEHRRRRGENLVGSCSDALLRSWYAASRSTSSARYATCSQSNRRNGSRTGGKSVTIQLEELTNEPIEPRRQMTGPPTGVSVVRMNNVFASSTPTGSVSENAAPAPASLLIVNSPPMPRAKSRLIAKPSPTPC